MKAAMGAAAVRGVMVPPKRPRRRGRGGLELVVLVVEVLGVVWDWGLWVGGRLVIVVVPWREGERWWCEYWCWL